MSISMLALAFLHGGLLLLMQASAINASAKEHSEDLVPSGRAISAAGESEVLNNSGRRMLKVEGRIIGRYIAQINGSNEINARSDDGVRVGSGDRKANGTALFVVVRRGSKSPESYKLDLYYYVSVARIEGKQAPIGVALEEGLYYKTGDIISIEFPGKWVRQKGSKISDASFSLTGALRDLGARDLVSTIKDLMDDPSSYFLQIYTKKYKYGAIRGNFAKYGVA